MSLKSIASAIALTPIAIGSLIATVQAQSINITTDGTTPWTVSVPSVQISSATPYIVKQHYIGSTPIPTLALTTNGLSNGTFVGGGSASSFDGFWTASLVFSLPSNAVNVSLNFSNFLADDRGVLELNGVIIASAGLAAPGTGSMVLTDGGVPGIYAFASVTTSGTVASGFKLGSTNTLTLIVNNTSAGIHGPDANITSGNGTLAGLVGTVSFSVPRISPGGRTLMASGGLGDSNNPPSYVQNPNAYSFILTDGITTLTGQQRRNNDPTGGPNKDLQAMTTFDGRQLTVSGTVSALSLVDTQGASGGSQYLSIGLVTRGQLDRAATTYNEKLTSTPASGKDGFAGIVFGWFTDQNGGHLYLTGQDWDGQKDKIYLDLTALGLANGQSITQPITFSMVFSASTLVLTVNGQSRGSTPISHDLSNVALIASADSESLTDGPASMTFSNVAAATPSTIGAPNLIYALSGNGQSDMAGSKLAMPLVVGVVDSYRNPVPGTAVSFTGANATASPSMVQTDPNGQASAQIALGNTVGPATITATAGTASATFSFSVTGSPGPVVNAVVNGASFVGGGIVPGEIATVFGTNLTSNTGINLASSLPLPAVFLNVSVIVNDPPVPLFAVDNVNGQQQVNFQVPWGVAGHANASVAISNNGVTGTAINVPVLAAQPGIFSYNVGGNNFGAILHADFQLADTGHPAVAGETVLIYCTGLGMVNSPPADGVAGNGQTTVATPDVTIGGTQAAVSFSGLAPGFVGLYQINAVVPAGLTTGNQPVVISMGSVSSNSALLPVH